MKVLGMLIDRYCGNIDNGIKAVEVILFIFQTSWKPSWRLLRRASQAQALGLGAFRQKYWCSFGWRCLYITPRSSTIESAITFDIIVNSMAIEDARTLVILRRATSHININYYHLTKTWDTLSIKYTLIPTCGDGNANSRSSRLSSISR